MKKLHSIVLWSQTPPCVSLSSESLQRYHLLRWIYRKKRTSFFSAGTAGIQGGECERGKGKLLLVPGISTLLPWRRVTASFILLIFSQTIKVRSFRCGSFPHKVADFAGVPELSFHVPLPFAVQLQGFHDSVLYFLCGRPRRKILCDAVFWHLELLSLIRLLFFHDG